MLINLLFLLAISSGSVLAAVVWNREYEDALPITISGIILIQFIMGVIGFLETGFIITACVIIMIWGISLFILIRERKMKSTIQAFFSPGFWLFLLLYAGFHYIFYGMKMHEWDEFSHWGTVVKAMIQTGRLGTVPQAHLPYGSYPPGMALFQLFLQRIYRCFWSGGFSEWRLYLAYAVFAASFILPLIKRVGAKTFKHRIVAALVFFLVPVFFFQYCYHTLYIDPILGILAGVGLAMVVVISNKQNNYCLLYVLSVCFSLTLMKVSGILMAVFVGIAYITDYVLQTAPSLKNLSKHIGAFILSIGLSELLWSIFVKSTEAPRTTPIKFSFADLCNLLTGKDDSYRTSCFNYFKTALFDNTSIEGNTNFIIQNLGLSISYFSLLIIFLLVIYWSWNIFRRDNPIKARSIFVAALASLICWLCFYIGLGITYLFKFSEEEALRLASYSRYVHTMYLGMYLLAATVILQTVFTFYCKKTVLVVILGITLLITPLEDIAKLLFRDTVRESIVQREPYEEISKKIRDVSQPYDNVFLVCQDEHHWISGAAYWRISFEARPAVIDHIDEGWFMSAESTDWYMSDKNAAQLRQLLLDNYDYVALYMLDDYFYATFSSLFTNPEDIGENCVYKINKESGLLELCE